MQWQTHNWYLLGQMKAHTRAEINIMHLTNGIFHRMKESFPAAAFRQIEIDCGSVYVATALGIIRMHHTHTHTHSHAQINWARYCIKLQISQESALLLLAVCPHSVHHSWHFLSGSPTSNHSFSANSGHYYSIWILALCLWASKVSNVSSNITLYCQLIIPFISLFIFSFLPFWYPSITAGPSCKYSFHPIFACFCLCVCVCVCAIGELVSSQLQALRLPFCRHNLH